ncbi:hypothetical protein [Acinetobacter sp. YH12027]|uniref:hypothetical protein n=1 Tax=Acinetobacter sp. YH12027 TaxID=2601043 RepID=UPI0015D4605C|nr:hypothetical protein [Acinetobacter sp. YH12027]
MGFWSSLIDSGAFRSVGSAMFNLNEYKKYGSVYRVLEINSSEADRNLGVGEDLTISLKELSDVNAQQFLEEPLQNIFTLYDDQKKLAHEKLNLDSLKSLLERYEYLSNQLDDSQPEKTQKLQEEIQEVSENIEAYKRRIIDIESHIQNNPINLSLDR